MNDIFFKITAEEESLIQSLGESDRNAAISVLKEAELLDDDTKNVVNALISKLSSMSDADYNLVYNAIV